MIKLYNKDCFEAFEDIKKEMKREEDKIDCICVDLPYGQTACKWDSLIDLDKMWVELKKICKKDCIYIFFCTTKFGVSLINSNPKWFKYDLVWEKTKAVGFLNANRQPLRSHEMIYIFYNKRRTYNPQKTPGKPYGARPKTKDLDGVYGGITRSDKGNASGDRRPKSVLKSKIVKDVYNEYDSYKKTPNPSGDRHPKSILKPGSVYRDIHTRNKSKVIEDSVYSKFERVTINESGDRHPKSVLKPKIVKRSGEVGLYGIKRIDSIPDPEGLRHPKSIQLFKSGNKTKHPTEKPLEALEWLIKSYTNEGDLVMDFTMGSGTCGLACKNLKRDFIGVELLSDYFKLCEDKMN